MTSMQDALTEALEHPREYHPVRPRPLQKKSRQQTNSTSFFWGVVASFAAAGLLLKFYKRHSA